MLCERVLKVDKKRGQTLIPNQRRASVLLMVGSSWINVSSSAFIFSFPLCSFLSQTLAQESCDKGFHKVLLTASCKFPNELVLGSVGAFRPPEVLQVLLSLLCLLIRVCFSLQHHSSLLKVQQSKVLGLGFSTLKQELLGSLRAGTLFYGGTGMFQRKSSSGETSSLSATPEGEVVVR